MDEIMIKIIRKLQEELPLVKEPYKEIASKLGITEKELLNKIDFMLKDGIIRRIGIRLNHNKAGFKSNVLVVWNIPDKEIDNAVSIMSKIPEISHCYQRETYPEWKYNLYTMIHGKKKNECEKIINEIILKIGINDYEVLYSLSELKKTSMVYFNEK